VHVAPVEISAPLLKSLDALAMSESATRFVIFAALLNAFLFRLTGQPDITVVAPSQTGRGLVPELSSLLGRITDLLVLRTSMCGEPTFREVVRRQRAAINDPDADLPSALTLDEDSSLDRVLLNVVDVRIESILRTDGNLSASFVDIRGLKGAQRRADLVWYVVPERQSVLLGSADTFEVSTIERFSRNLRQVIETALTNPETRLRPLSF
jgi:non-ribosomal peptide synthetase component F